jgi:CDP-diacylglycerol--glycerol-3-phosphate 3-phosphatidyltransferase
MSAPPALPVADRDGRGGLAQLKERLRDTAHAVLSPAVAALASAGLKADHVTWTGFAIAILAGFAFFDGHSRLASLFLVLAGLCDILDGELARRSGARSRFGAFLDSTLDRLGESAALVGIAAFCVRNLVALIYQPAEALAQMSIGLTPVTWGVLSVTAILALVGSFMVSYTRARAEGLGLDCKVGWFERPERLVLLIIAGALKVFWAMSIALLLLTIFSFITAAQRVMHVHKNTRGAGSDT